jgi:hypothetical protein
MSSHALVHAKTNPVLLREPLIAFSAVSQRRVNIRTSLSPERLAEAEAYLSMSGDTNEHIAFLVRHGFYDRAFFLAIERALSPKVESLSDVNLISWSSRRLSILCFCRA